MDPKLTDLKHSLLFSTGFVLLAYALIVFFFITEFFIDGGVGSSS